MEENKPSLDNMSYEKTGGNFTWSLTDSEMDKFDGHRISIEDVQMIKATSKFGKDSLPLPPGQEREVYVIELTSKPFGEDQIGNNIVHTERYNLKQKDDDTWIVSLHEKSKTAQFLSKYKIDNFKLATSLENGVVLVKKTNPKTNKSFMTISI